MKFGKLEKKILKVALGDFLVPGKLAYDTINRKDLFNDPITAFSKLSISLAIPSGIYFVVFKLVETVYELKDYLN